MLPINRKLGKLPFEERPGMTRAVRFMDRDIIPPAPPRLNYYRNISGPLGMLGNDRYGLCGLAAYAHLLMAVMATAGRKFHVTTKQCERAYFDYTGGADCGVNIFDFLNYAMKTPVFGHRVIGHCLIEPKDHVASQLATTYYGGVLVGVQLPDAALMARDWLTPGKPNPRNGHAITSSEFDDPAQTEGMASWGEIFLTSREFSDGCCDERHLVVFEEFTLAGTGKTICGWDESAMIDRAQEVAAT